MNIKVLLSLAILFISFSISAQDGPWSLIECIEYAKTNNISIQQAKLQAEVNKNNLQTARWDYVPNLSLSSNYGWNFGLNIDPVTNQISQQSRQTANMQLSSSWVLLDGGRKWNSISQNNQSYLAALYEYETAINDISINIASGFLQILLNKQIATVNREQVRITQLQVDRMSNLVEAGSNPLGDLLQLQAQLARDRQSLITAENAVTISKLQLANILQLPNPAAFDVVEPELNVPEPALVTRNPEGIFTTALETQPQIKGAEHRLESSKESVDVSKSGYYPRLSVVAQVGSNYSDQIPNVTGTQLQTFPIGVVPSTGEQVISQQQIIQTAGIKPFGEQVSDNVNEFVGLNLSVPIFNRMAVKNSVQNARLQQEIARLNYEQEKNNLKQSVYQAHADAKASYNAYVAAEKAVESSQKAFDYAQQRYNVGALNQLDFETAKNNLASAQSQMFQAKYDYIFKIKVLQFYLTNQVQ